MNYYIIYYPNGKKIQVQAKNSLELVRLYDLASKDNLGVRFIQLSGNNKKYANI